MNTLDDDGSTVIKLFYIAFNLVLSFASFNQKLNTQLSIFFYLVNSHSSLYYGYGRVGIFHGFTGLGVDCGILCTHYACWTLLYWLYLLTAF